MITEAQLWYICTVFPEAVKHEEVAREYEEQLSIEDDRELKDSLWRDRAQAIQRCVREHQTDTSLSDFKKALAALCLDDLRALSTGLFIQNEIMKRALK